MIRIESVVVFPRERCSVKKPIASITDAATELEEERLEEYREQLEHEYFEKLNRPVDIRFEFIRL